MPMTRLLNKLDLSTTRKSSVAIFAVVLIVGVLAALVMLNWHITQRTEALADELILQTAAAFEEVPPFTNADATALRRFPNRIHVERARELGIPRIPDREAAVQMLESDTMVRLEDSQYYVVLDLGYSVPYVTQDAANLLDVIGARFQARLRELGLPAYRFLVTSATRTDDDQRRLRQVNANAAENSSHFHGTTVDIHYARWDYDVTHDSISAGRGISQALLEERLQTANEGFIADHHPKLKSILADVMRRTQEDGLVMVTYERMQPVYHITVNTAIASPDEVLDESPIFADNSGAMPQDDLEVEVVAPAR